MVDIVTREASETLAGARRVFQLSVHLQLKTKLSSDTTYQLTPPASKRLGSCP